MAARTVPERPGSPARCVHVFLWCHQSPVPGTGENEIGITPRGPGETEPGVLSRKQDPIVSACSSCVDCTAPRVKTQGGRQCWALWVICLSVLVFDGVKTENTKSDMDGARLGTLLGGTQGPT